MHGVRLCAFFCLLSFGLQGAAGDNPDVKGAERLFDSWIRGQMAYRGLPGIAIGVVHDQELIWAQGFGFGLYALNGGRKEASDRSQEHNTLTRNL